MPVVVKVLTKENYANWLKNAKIEFASISKLSKENIVLAEVKN
jgi:hypothetical protein